MVDENEIVQNLYTYKPYKERILFNYLRNEAIENDNFPKEKAISLWMENLVLKNDWLYAILEIKSSSTNYINLSSIKMYTI